MHTLWTAVAHRPRLHVLRLLPGADLLTELLHFVTARGMNAAVVVTCVGSTGTTRLRPAGGQSPVVFEGPFEILSLSGTIGNGGQPNGNVRGGADGEVHHLHCAVSDSTCAVVGGHLLQGTVVRTTAEIVLAEVEGVVFARPHDPRTGYAELSISERAPVVEGPRPHHRL
eukprot:COSAG01_NODE_1910_length_8928_cov_33.079964_10_plen_170_part_00